MGHKMTFIATGDSFITRRIPPTPPKSFTNLISLIQKAEVRFTNLEVTIHNLEGFPAANSGGTWAVASPTVLKDLKIFGFNLVNWANNHTLDYLYGGLESTEKYLNEYGFVHSGVGQNLAEASEPKYLDCSSGRVALIGVTSTFHDFARAGEQRRDMIGRPGINPLRIETIYHLTKKRIQQLITIASDLEMDISHWHDKISNKSFFQFDNYVIMESKYKGSHRKLLKTDINRILKAIEEAKRQADYIIVSIHSHESPYGLDFPADFLEVFAKQCIDYGAHAIVGHGPHTIRGIEIYKNRPIFYSLGNFIFQNETVTKLPHDFYEEWNLSHFDNVADAFDARKRAFDFGNNKSFWESIVPFWTMENGELKDLTLYPIELGYGLARYQRGWPTLSNKQNILEKVKGLSKTFDTKIEIDQSIGKVIL
ncbi:capsule biosynthesis protein [Bacillus endophyticus]|uniref:CapA family protein n=1 Tax=Priestia endophytica TaxID=135735 RepID=UPI0018CCE3AE|nr:CapA family protein [Priestia endophytica]MBG9810152.1 capsule biosynthesis protein [Priestia endophytica]